MEAFGFNGDTNEHIFQAMKALSEAERKWVMSSTSPFEAKKRGRQITMRPDWNGISRRVMLELNLAKYKQNSSLASALVLTYPQTLVEGNNWGDDYWGAVPATEQDRRRVLYPYPASDEHLIWQDDETGLILVGANWLGRILMMIRDVIK